jgi:hypothetical protein
VARTETAPATSHAEADFPITAAPTGMTRLLNKSRSRLTFQAIVVPCPGRASSKTGPRFPAAGNLSSSRTVPTTSCRISPAGMAGRTRSVDHGGGKSRAADARAHRHVAGTESACREGVSYWNAVFREAIDSTGRESGRVSTQPIGRSADERPPYGPITIVQPRRIDRAPIALDLRHA